MSRKQKKKDAREQSTRQLMGIDVITDYGIATRMGELVFFACLLYTSDAADE